MIYCFDIDGTICTLEKNSQYEIAQPFAAMISKINDLYSQGHTIKFFTARGCNSGIDHTDLTTGQLKSWGVNYHELIMNRKPHYDLLIDDKAVNVEDWMRCMGVKNV
jgi:carbamoyl-phosphate synthase large subunit